MGTLAGSAKERPDGHSTLGPSFRSGRENVHSDIQALKEIGLIEDHENGVWVPFDKIESHIVLASVA